MTEREQKADDLVRAVYHEVYVSAHTPIVLDITGSARDLILSYADGIRRECAERAVAWAKRYDGDDGYEVTIDKLSAAIMGKE